MTIENIVNQALDQIGYVRHIGNIYEGTPAARVALDLWAQTRDSLFIRARPDWARKDANLVVAKSAPGISGSTAQYTADWDPATNPPLPWLYEYDAPTDCLYPLQIKPQRVFLPVWAPRPHTFRHITSTTRNIILTNTPDAILTYIYQILNPDLWESDFTDLMVQTLGQKMQAEFAKGAPPKENEDANPS